MRIRRWLSRLAAGMAVLFLLVLGAGAYVLWASLPKTDGTLEVAGLSGTVTIDRDPLAIPTIRAGSLEDAYFGMGFVHGQDRLWQMEFLRRIGQGRLAAILGPEALPIDRFIRTLGLYEIARESAAQLRQETRDALLAYARGINAAIDAYPVLPPEFLLLRHQPEPWRIEDCLVFMRLIAWDLSRNWREEILTARLVEMVSTEQLQDLFPPQPAGAPVSFADNDSPTNIDPGLLEAVAALRDPLDAAFLLPEGITGKGSNIWLLGGERTADGTAILANDPHLALRTPGPFYLAQIETPEAVLQGATMPSLPFVIAGRNQDIAWGLTNTGPDSQDLFLEKLDPQNPEKYLTPAGSARFVTRHERIEVRGDEPEILEVRTSRHGPIISDIAPTSDSLSTSEQVVALAWTGLDPADVSVEAAFDLAHADDWGSFNRALEAFGAPMSNVGYADKDGRIGLVAAGHVPIRRQGDGTRPVPGWSGDYDWIGRIPFEDLPRQFKPVEQQLLNANNRLVNDAYPYLITQNWSPALRARRIETLLNERTNWTATQIETMQRDDYSMLAHDFLPLLLDAWRQEEAVEPIERALLTALAAWDRRMAPDRPEPLVFAAWYNRLAETVYADELADAFSTYRGVRSDFLARIFTQRPVWCDDVRTPETESCEARALLAFHLSVEELQAAWGEEWRDWRFGDAHRALMPHRPFHEVGALAWLFDIDLAKGGDSSTIDVGHWRWREPFTVTLAPTLRMITAPGTPLMRVGTATGQVGHPLSAHYRDLTRRWIDGPLHNLSLDEAWQRSRLTLIP